MIQNTVRLLLLRSNAGMVMSDMEVDVLDELGSSLQFLLGSPQLVPEVSPRWPQATLKLVHTVTLHQSPH